MVHTYLLDGVVVGFLGLATDQKRAVKLDKSVFKQLFSGFGGDITYKTVSAALERINVFSPDEICVDYIATSPEHRSKGIGKELIAYVRDNLGYKYIRLEVFSKNPRAKAFYERQGFDEVGTKTNLISQLQGFGKLITMRMDAEKANTAL